MTRRGWIAGLIAMLWGSRAGAAPMQDAPADAMRAARARLRAGFPYPVTTVPGVDALATWERMRAAGGGWPVIVGGDEGLDAICDQYGMGAPSVPTPGASGRTPPDVAQTIAASRTITMPDGLRQWPGHGRDRTPASGPWPEPAEGTARVMLTTATDLATGKPFDRVHIVTLPTDLSWQAPAYLRWGNWNACPPAAYHCAALRGWQERHGAELVGIDGDTINLRVKRRPKDRAEALALARECHAYCPDTVDQGMGTIEALAAALLANDWWFFWWD